MKGAGHTCTCPIRTTQRQEQELHYGAVSLLSSGRAGESQGVQGSVSVHLRVLEEGGRAGLSPQEG